MNVCATGDNGCWRGKSLDAVAVDERAIPELQVQQRPDRVTTPPNAATMIREQALHRGCIGDAALLRAAIEQHLACDVAPASRDPLRKRVEEVAAKGGADAAAKAVSDFLTAWKKKDAGEED